MAAEAPPVLARFHLVLPLPSTAWSTTAVPGLLSCAEPGIKQAPVVPADNRGL